MPALLALALLALVIGPPRAQAVPHAGRGAASFAQLSRLRLRLLHAPPAAPLPRGPVAPAAGALPDQATVSFPPSSDGALVGREVTGLGLRLDGALRGLPGRTVYRVLLPPGTGLDAALHALAALPGAIAAEPVYEARAQWHPNDPLYQTQQRYLRAIGAEQAWSMQLGNPNVVVAVVDSGVDISHQDLQGQIWTNPNAGSDGCGDDPHGCNFVDPASVDPSCPNTGAAPVPNGDVSPSYFHGTFIAGVIAARTNNGLGVAGIVPHGTIMPVKVGDCVGVPTFAEAQGILYAAQQGAQIINLSIGEENCGQAVSYLRDAIAQAQAEGALVVAAAGNAGQNCISAPANVTGVLTVASTDATLAAHATFSDWGPEVAVAAPGVGIAGPIPGPDKLYDVKDGTSFSAPIVAGLAGLLLSQNPLLTPDQLRDLIQRGAAPLADGTTPGWAGAGRIDLAGSLRLVPAAIYGQVTIDGDPAPDGTVVDAFVGGQRCGEAQTQTIGGEAMYTLFVPPALDTPGCGAAGAPVTLVAQGAAGGSVAWSAGAIAVDLDLAPSNAAQRPPA